jgi:hypothetical protein
MICAKYHFRAIHHRYWKHVLEREKAVCRSHPCFASWMHNSHEECMFTSKQVKTWGSDHLAACHWYIKMPVDNTPSYEEHNRRNLEPVFKARQAVQ